MRRQSVVVEPTNSVIPHEDISEAKFDASNFSSLLPNLVQTTGREFFCSISPKV